MVAAGVFIFLTGQALLGATKVGISTDEPVHQSRTNVWMRTGWYLPERFMTEEGEFPSASIDAGRIHAYGASFGLLAHGVNVLTGVWRPVRATGPLRHTRGAR